MNPGDILDGRYEIVARLGAGGMGEVYKATHTFLGSPRVIKVVHPQIATNTDARERFLREARIATKVQHPNVATLHDFASLPDGSHYMVWEFIEGENLAQKLRTAGTLPPRQAVRIAIQALHGLEAIHRAGIVHRDISPENLMISADGSVKIIDLGVAKFDDPDAVSQTRTGIFVGKLRYAAPEQLGFLPEGEKIDGRADLYALAMVVVELLTGRPPYEAKSPHEYFLHHAREVPITTVELPASLPGSDALQDVLQRALRRDRNERFASASEFAAALETIERTLPDAAATSTVVLPLDADATWRPSDHARETQRTPAPATDTPTIALTAPPAAATLLTPLPDAGAPPAPVYIPPPPPQTKSSNRALLVVLVLLLLAGAAGAGYATYRFWPKITSVISGTTTPKNPDLAAVRTVTPPARQSESSLSVTPQTTSSAAAAAPLTLTTPPATAAQQTQQHPRTQPSQPAASQPAAPQSQVAEETGRVRPAIRNAPTYVDSPGGYGRNERAIDRLHEEMRGVHQVALLAGSDQVVVYRAIHRYLPKLTFDADAPVVIRFGSTSSRLGYDSQGLGSTATIEKNGEVIFRYNLYGDRASAADAFAQAISEAFGD